jgi:glycerophosphoryl diester phosphodiesterase
LLQPPIAFAHRGARAHAPENTLDAFGLAMRLGATGLESDVWLTRDGIPVLRHDARVRVGRRTRRISEVDRADLPPSVPTLAELYTTCGDEAQLSLDIKDPAAVVPVLEVAAATGGTALEHLWVCAATPEDAIAWRETARGAHIVCSTRRRAIGHGGERLAARLAEAGVDAVNLHASDWSGGLTTLFHRFERLCFGWDAQYERVILALRRMGIDGVYSDHVDRLVETLLR